MGIWGKFSCKTTEYVAKKSLKALRKKKKSITPGFFNKFLVFISRFFSKNFCAKCSGKVFCKSQKKRKF